MDASQIRGKLSIATTNGGMAKWWVVKGELSELCAKLYCELWCELYGEGVSCLPETEKKIGWLTSNREEVLKIYSAFNQDLYSQQKVIPSRKNSITWKIRPITYHHSKWKWDNNSSNTIGKNHIPQSWKEAKIILLHVHWRGMFKSIWLDSSIKLKILISEESPYSSHHMCRISGQNDVAFISYGW